jgi:serine/threonine protein kinase
MSSSNLPKKVTFLNKGTYGCIYHPGINCKGKKENIRYVTKIQENDSVIQNELDISSKIMKIKGYIRYFAPIMKKCAVKIAKPFQDEIKKCDPLNIKSKSDFDNKFILTKLRYLGKTDLSTYITEMFTTKDAPISMHLFKQTHSFLLKSISKLLDAGIIHYDIKGNNIMYDKKANNSIIIDFGMSFTINTLIDYKNDNSVDITKIFFANQTYAFWAIDIHIINYIIKMKMQNSPINKNTIDDIFSVFLYNGKEGGRVENAVFIYAIQGQDVAVRDFTKKYNAFMEQFIGLSGNDVIYYFIDNQTYKTWDSYAIEVTMMTELMKLVFNGLDITDIETDVDYYKMRFQDTIFSMPNERKFLEIFQ